jgi:hypothetical protein
MRGRVKRCNVKQVAPAGAAAEEDGARLVVVLVPMQRTKL